jgi:hypothetical protein
MQTYWGLYGLLPKSPRFMLHSRMKHYKVCCGLSPRGSFHRSGPTEKRDTAPERDITGEADCYFVSIDYDRDLRLSPGVDEHFLKFVRVFINVDVDSPVAVGCPSLGAEGSGIRAINNDFICHDVSSL